MPKHVTYRRRLIRASLATFAFAAGVAGLRPTSAAAVPQPEPRLEELLTTESVWLDGASEFMLHYAPLDFGYMSGRAVARSVAPELTLFSMRVWEALAYFEHDAVQRVELLLYSRADSGDLDQAAFEALVRQAHAALTKWAGPGRQGQVGDGRQRQTTRHHLWAAPPCAAQLTWAFTAPRRAGDIPVPFRGDFVKLTLVHSRSGGLDGLRALQPAPSRRGPVTGYALRERVRRDREGAVEVTGVPMVDQGQKGYCAAAAAERLLRYYGREVGQHEVAQLADTARDRGTTTEGMLQALRTIGRDYQLDVKTLHGVDYDDLVRLIEDYNRLAAAKGLQTLMYGRSIDVGALFNAMDASALRQARARRPQQQAAFLRDVRSYVDAGVPLLWACIVGKFPENPPIHAEGSFGHIRLITGYRQASGDLIYTDSWGPGHERKEMPLADAWAITFGLYVMKPRDVR
ncbi:MAG: hypothetical protein PHR35_01960 [Kiritimatiellae bacterium]|nr:hypothetical protein [Kiritimatiellia bacterium]